MPNTYPIEDFQSIYDSIYASMGDDATLRANIEAALKPMYEQSKQQLEQQRIARNADIDVDAASRGMQTSSWVTDAKLRQLRSSQDQLAALDANYNNQLFTALMNAQQNRDQNAYNQALQMYQLSQKGSGGGGGSGSAGGFWADGQYWDNAQAYSDYVLGNASGSTPAVENGYTSDPFSYRKKRLVNNGNGLVGRIGSGKTPNFGGGTMDSNTVNMVK